MKKSNFPLPFTMFKKKKPLFNSFNKLSGRALGFWKWCSRIFFKGRGKLNFFVLYFLITSNPNMAKIWCSRCYTCYTPNALPGYSSERYNLLREIQHKTGQKNSKSYFEFSHSGFSHSQNKRDDLVLKTN